MPNIKSAKKRMRQNEKKRLKNKIQKTRTKTQIKKFLKAIEDKDIESAKLEIIKVSSFLDKISQKGILHKNNVNRKKSKFQNMLNNLVEENQETES